VADHLNVLLGPQGGLFERQGHLGLEISAPTGRGAGPGPRPEAEEILEEVGEKVGEIRRLRADPPALQAGVAIHIVEPPLLRIGEDGVGLVDLLELLLGVG